MSSFQSDSLKPDVIPQSYIADTCEYLQKRWNPENSEPGTVVLPIMYHSIVPKDEPVTAYSAVGEMYFHTIMQTAESLGFEAITTQQLVDFLYHNARIPPRSMILIVDDRKRAAYFDIFIPYLKKHGWKVVNAWISHPDTPAYLWAENRQLADEGWVDFQAHGVIHNITLSEDALPEYVHQEIYGPLTAIPEHFGVPVPLAFIWPGGRFSAYAVQVAAEAGYKIGLTVYARGPLMYNWIPLGAEERAVENPLLVLPRAWSPNAANNLIEAAAIGDAAHAYAEQNRDSEMDWYNHYCVNYPSIPTSEAHP
ncbi:MAG TPA: polysaccharide deacetylase family protein [Anaerolineaceae bacterium]|nr:polysaccharide deacetylase family protein [Anaerolineaceae bacterium]